MNETSDKISLAIIGTAIIGIYTFFVKHIVGHVNTEQIKANRDDIQRIFEGKQSKESCQQIVKRMDENHQETNKKLDRILDKLEVS